MKTKTDNRSKIWKNYEGTLSRTGSLRGYGLNLTYSSRRVALYRKLILVLRRSLLLGRIFDYILFKAYIVVERFLSFLFFGEFRASEKYVFSKFDHNAYDPALLQRFASRFESQGVFFSHNTIKSFSYLEQLEPYLDVKDEISCLEVGAGVFNFGYLLSRDYHTYSHVIVDLPVMIEQCSALLKGHYEFDGEVFLPHEQEAFKLSTSKKKILFLEPHQVDEVEGEFDLLVNHESFAEMDIVTVNDYLKGLSKHVRTHGIAFLVNRISRPQARTEKDYSDLTDLDQVTNFSDYELGAFETLLQTVDPFRQKLREQQRNPNVLYIGRKI